MSIKPGGNYTPKETAKRSKAPSIWESIRAAFVMWDLKSKLTQMGKKGDYTMFDWAQISGLLRHLLTFGGGWMVANGWIDETTMMEVVGAVLTLVGLVWSFMSKREA